MPRRLAPLLLILALLVPLAGCGGSDDGGSGGDTAALLDGWSDTSLAALKALQTRAQAVQARDKQAYEKADADLQKQLKLMVGWPADAEETVGSDGDAGKAVAKDAEAWKDWATLLQQGDLSDKESLEAGKLGAAAAKAHLAAYKAAGADVPADFQRQAGGS